MKQIKVIFTLFLISLFILFCSCNTLKKVGEDTKNILEIRNLKYKISNLSNVMISNISLSNKKSISDISMAEGLRLVNDFSKKNIIADFFINVEIFNPNDGSPGFRNSIVTLTRLDWQLFIDDKPTISGGIEAPVEVPSGKKHSIIVLKASLNLFQFFGDWEYEDLIKLAFIIAGKGGSERIKLLATPTLTTSQGQVKAPKVTIIDSEFR